MAIFGSKLNIVSNISIYFEGVKSKNKYQDSGLFKIIQ